MPSKQAFLFGNICRKRICFVTTVLIIKTYIQMQYLWIIIYIFFFKDTYKQNKITFKTKNNLVKAKKLKKFS